MHYARRRMNALLTSAESLLSLGLAAFLAATVVPFSSEAVLFGVLRMHGELFWPALAVATVGNTAGGMSSWLIGRFMESKNIGSKKPLTQLERSQVESVQADYVRRWGAPALIFAWLPVVGDALCLASGWLRLDAMQVMFWQAAGRFARYWVVAQGAAL